MAQGPVKKLRSERARIEKYGVDGTLPKKTTDALLEWASAIHPKETDYNFYWPDDEPSDYAVSTVQGYLRDMRKIAERSFPDLLAISPSSFNSEIDSINEGRNPNVKPGGLAKTSLQRTQSAARSFFWYHDIAHPDEINVYGVLSEPSHDEDDLFTRGDVQALRKHVDGPRNRALLEMLLNTGQRISAIQGLRIQDVDLEQGSFRLNKEREGLKGAANRSSRRPLFGAKPYLASWIERHPLVDEPQSFVFIGDLDHHNTKPDQPLCQGTIRNMLLTTANRAGIDKPVNPLNFRHFWTTMMKQEYGLNDEEIKLILGHKRESNGLNLVYNHSISQKLLENVDDKISGSNDQKPKPLTPEFCGECGEELNPDWNCCPVCQTSYSPW